MISINKMTQEDWIRLQDKIKKVQDGERFDHTIGVMYTASALAMAYGYDVNRARMAGLLHDCAKTVVPNSQKAALCDKYGIKISDFERANPHLLHGKLGAYLAKHTYGIDDEEICSSITYHTTGKCDMTFLEQIVFIADYIEPNRNEMPRLDIIRKTAFTDLNKCTRMIMSDTLDYLVESGRPVDAETRQAYEFYMHKGEDDR